MGLACTLPPSPLTHEEAARIRDREDVAVFTTVGTTAIHSLRDRHREHATHAVALVDGTVRAFEFEGTGWSEELLRRDADRRDHLEAALDWM